MSELSDIIAFYNRVSQRNSQTDVLKSIEKDLENDVQNDIQTDLQADIRCALATVISTDGPSYRSPGARSFICEDGAFRGGLSAGCLEGDVGCRLESAASPFIVEYDLSTADDIRGFPFGCGGKVEILVEPLPDANALNAVHWLAALNEPAVLLTVVKSNDETFRLGARFGLDASAIGRYDGGLEFEGIEHLCLSSLRAAKSRTVEVDSQECKLTVFIEYFEPAVCVFVFGDGEDARILETFADNVGMNVKRISRQQIRSGTALAADFPRLGHAYSVVMTHDLDLDTNVVGRLLAVAPPYLGVLGPRSRTDRILQAIQQQSTDVRMRTLAQNANLYSPVGLDLGAETPGEIALSIVAEIQTVARGRQPRHLRDHSGAIHERNDLGAKIDHGSNTVLTDD